MSDDVAGSSLWNGVSGCRTTVSATFDRPVMVSSGQTDSCTVCCSVELLDSGANCGRIQAGVANAADRCTTNPHEWVSYGVLFPARTEV